MACDSGPLWNGFSPPGCCLLAVVRSTWQRDFPIPCLNTLSPCLFRPLPRTRPTSCLSGRSAWLSCSVGTGSRPGAWSLSFLIPVVWVPPSLPVRHLRGRLVKLLDNINHWILLEKQDFWLFKITWSAFPLSHVASSGRIGGHLSQGSAHPSPRASPPCRLRMTAACPEMIFL